MNVVPLHPPGAMSRRVLPHNLDAEAAILGGVLVRTEVLSELGHVETDHFYDMRHRVVWGAIRNLAHKRQPIDPLTLELEVERAGKLDAIGGVAFIGELALRVPTADNVAHYAREVATLYRNRQAILKLSEQLERAYTWQHEPEEMVGEIAGELARLEQVGQPKARFKAMTPAEALEELGTIADAPVYPTPFPTLNDLLGFGGFLGTQCYTVAAGTGRGKTTLVAAIAMHSAQTVPVIVASYEMKPGYFLARRAAGLLGIHSNDILRCRADMGLVLRTVDSPRMILMHRRPLSEVRAAVEFMKERFGVAPILIVDYIQKLADEIALTMQRPDMRLATTQASSTLCDIAEKTGAAVVAVSAIGRGKGKIMLTPRKFEPYELVEVAKESGAVEYDGAAMIVLTVSKDLEGESRIATITVAKNRFGREAHIDARYDGRRGLWEDVGLVQDEVDVPTPPAVEENRSDVIRRLVLAELAARPALNKTALIRRIRGCRKMAVIEAYEALWIEGSIAKIGGAVTITEKGRGLYQTTLEGVS
jgi:replicative DNA helicase